MTHIEEARKLAKDYADFFCQPECVDAIAAALAAAEERGRSEERERCAKLHGSMELFGHWSKHRLADGVFLPLVCYVPEGPDYTSVPLYAITKEPTP